MTWDGPESGASTIHALLKLKVLKLLHEAGIVGGERDLVLPGVMEDLSRLFKDRLGAPKACFAASISTWAHLSKIKYQSNCPTKYEHNASFT